MTEKVLDAENWCLEADAVIKDVENHVLYIKLSESLISTNQHIYLNVTTKENTDYCIELSGLGFRIVGKQFDKTDAMEEEWFETPYSLLNRISPMFSNSFGNALVNKLNDLIQ